MTLIRPAWWTVELPWIHELPDSADIEAILRGRPADALVFQLDGARMHTHDGLFTEFASALNFPDYFGRNWPALQDCLDDLTWLDETSHVLIICSNWPEVLRDASSDRVVLRRILERSAKDWATLGFGGDNAKPVAFNVVALGSGKP